MWENVKKIFARKNRCLEIPEQKHGSGRYVQYPKSQRLITWRELSCYADEFIHLHLELHQILSFNDFCIKVFSGYQDEIIKKIVFSFYDKWDGSSTVELREPKHKSKSQPLFMKNRVENYP